jgi:hypothetical protein
VCALPPIEGPNKRKISSSSPHLPSPLPRGATEGRQEKHNMSIVQPQRIVPPLGGASGMAPPVFDSWLEADGRSAGRRIHHRCATCHRREERPVELRPPCRSSIVHVGLLASSASSSLPRTPTTSAAACPPPRLFLKGDLQVLPPLSCLFLLYSLVPLSLKGSHLFAAARKGGIR